MINISSIWLIALIAAFITFGVILIDDGYLALTGQITWTEWAQLKWWRRPLLIGLSSIIPVALTFHLYTFWSK